MRPRVIPVRRYPLGVLVRLTGALVAALALLTALPAGAAAQLSREPQKVYDDYRSDAAIEPCDHTVAVYRRTLQADHARHRGGDARLPPRGRGGAARARARPPGLPRAGLADPARRRAATATATATARPEARRAAPRRRRRRSRRRPRPPRRPRSRRPRRPRRRPAARTPLPRPRPPRRRPSRRRPRSRTRRRPRRRRPCCSTSPTTARPSAS